MSKLSDLEVECLECEQDDTLAFYFDPCQGKSMNCDCMMCLSEGPEAANQHCTECQVELTGDDPEGDMCLECSKCPHDESENGICNDCGDEVDWVSRKFRETEKD